ncbi:alpha/beta hydrolase [Chelativorans sp. M5D2P16]|uniref:alpha/beta fold hydrolase n=1 Tax=Chelativorans sp. M5D2P16 TaxID=3095678 RepID=UPI002ACA0F4E|nr:alpha/beta hydrolase [Chelativorans sp. M5D2P16]MDZ5697653.1 alpha/beta hydrolase [Chelativorans sp. M5D2P16]
MQSFFHDRLEIAFIDEGEGDPVLLIHGFASTHLVNWVSPGWVKTLRDAGYRVIALDNRGHGRSSKSHEPQDYTPEKMAGDAAALLAHLGIVRAHVMGYSMGARIAAFLALGHPDLPVTLVFGGLGIGMVEGVGDWDAIADALLAEDPDSIGHERGRMFRAFADQTKSDRHALAACISTSRTLLTPEQVSEITVPTLVAVGTNDDIAGAPEPLAQMLPHGEAFAVEGRDHMLSVGDRTFKARVLDFLKEHAL